MKKQVVHHQMKPKPGDYDLVTRCGVYYKETLWDGLFTSRAWHEPLVFDNTFQRVCPACAKHYAEELQTEINFNERSSD